MRQLILVSLSVVFALFGLSSKGDSQTIKIGAVVPLTGRYAALGGQVKTGYEIAVRHINAAGGVTAGGQKLQIELTMLDDESDPTKTVARLETLASQGVVAYLGGAGSDLSRWRIRPAPSRADQRRLAARAAARPRRATASRMAVRAR